MLYFLDGQVLLTLFIVIAAGAAFGAIPFGPLRFGAAGSLFIGLAVGAFVDLPEESLTIFQDLGLGMFVYMVGLEAGETFFKNFREQLLPMGAAILSVSAAAAAAVFGAQLLGITREVALGVFSGSLTSTPSLALATDQTGSEAPAVGYSLGYPTGVALAILVVAFTINREWKARNDQIDPDEKKIRMARIKVTKDVAEADIEALEEEWGDQFQAATIIRDGHRSVLTEFTDVRQGDTIAVLATKAALPAVIRTLGKRVGQLSMRRDDHLTIQSFRVSNQDIAGKSVGDLPFLASRNAQVIRLRRGDEVMLAHDELYLEYGDIAEVVMPTTRTEQVRQYFGDSVQAFSELDWIAAAGGLALGFLLALLEIPLPGGSSFALGAAAGPLIIGIILGAVQRTGRTAWQLPRTANYTLRQLGLMMFLAAVGTASGPAFVNTAFTLQGLVTIGLAALTAIVGCGVYLAVSWAAGQSATRANGGLAGVLGQPAVLQYALENESDSRIMSGYTATFALALIYKILVIPVMVIV
ncbi:antiporter [Corynebacterium frankenforstense]|uniref:aspartate-alanine antiporter-like transporter n=1 Tax=Corynebacterium frankenforstense TaxID=1230998 RepID=UPI0026EDE08A|nr:antiporter [Corynebacterium frankenforstense]